MVLSVVMLLMVVFAFVVLVRITIDDMPASAAGGVAKLPVVLAWSNRPANRAGESAALMVLSLVLVRLLEENR